MATPDELKRIKERATRALKKQDWAKALEAHQELAKAQPKDLRVKLKIGEILIKLKRQDEAMKTYQEVAEAYSKDKFLIQAVSVYKLMQQIDPAYPGLGDKLEDLNRARGIPQVRTLPAAVPPDAEPGLEIEVEVEVSAEAEAARETLQAAISAARAAAAARKHEPAQGHFPETPLFSQLGAEEFTQVVSKFQVGTIPKNTLVIKEGTKGDSFFIISHGDVRVFRTHPKSGKKITLAHLKDGAFFGEMAFFLDSVRQASCETAEESVLLRVSRPDLEELMVRYPNIRAVMRDFFKRRALDQMFKTMSLFETLEDAEKEALTEKFEMVEAEPGTTLIKEGEEGQYFWLIYAGEVEVSATNEDQGPVKLATIGPGDYVGEISLVMKRPNTADVVASARSVLFRLPKAVFSELLAMNLFMLDELTAVIEERLQSTNQALTPS
jgi:CRP-like cAMP-binding protein